MKDLIAKLQMDANCALGAIWLHIYAQAARIAELEAEIAALRAAPLPADTDKLRDENALMHAAINCGHVIMAHRIVLECDPDKPGNALSQLRERLNAAASTAGQAPAREIPEDWQLVPKTITHAMAREINLTGTFTDAALQTRYAALLAAAPLPAAPVQTEPKP